MNTPIIKSKKRRLIIFILSIIIVVTVLIIISIVFSYAVPKNNSQNGNTNVTSTTVIPNITTVGINNESAVDSNYAQQQANLYKNIKTIDGKPIDPRNFPYYDNSKPFSIAIKTDSVSVFTCSSQTRATPDQLSARKIQLANILTKLNLSNQNKFEYGIDESC